ncbi:MAG: indole-3-glycerol phosphate synthase TrpC [Parvularculaceae bacterium]
MTILDEIIFYKKDEIKRAKKHVGLNELEQHAIGADPVRGFADKLRAKASTAYALIAEVKKASPSKGLIRPQFYPANIAKDYEKGGATCLSVLTDGPSFQGHADYLKQARAATELPVLRKDFMIDPYQVYEARAWNADCILLIMACLSDAQAAELEDVARSFELDVLIETHNEAELERALALKSTLIGINNRDLNNFETDLGISERLAKLCPPDHLVISESGITSPADLTRLAKSNIRSFLVGESLMRQPNIEKATKALLDI